MAVRKLTGYLFLWAVDDLAASLLRVTNQRKGGEALPIASGSEKLG